MGSLCGHVCETLRDLRGVFCSQNARRRLRTSRAHVFAWRTPRIARFVFFLCAGDVMAACTCGWSPAGGSNPCRMVPSMWDEVHVQLHDVTGKVQHARLIVAMQRCAMCELPRWTRIVNLTRVGVKATQCSPVYTFIVFIRPVQ